MITNQPQRRTSPYQISRMPKPLPPTLRERNRYIVLEFIGDTNFSKKDITKILWNSALQFLGEIGTSKLNLWITDWDENKNRGIIKVTHKSVDDIKTSIALIKEINGVRVIPQVIGVSGTLKNARRYLK